jgi:protein-tyrosine-phosphatase
MAEAILNNLGSPRFLAYSAGSRPAEKVHSLTIELLGSLHYPTLNLRSKSWLDFTYTASPNFDLVITVCDDTASDVCQVWPGNPVIIHWNVPDPTLASGNPVDQLKAFAHVYQDLERRIRYLVQLPPGPLSRDIIVQHFQHMDKPEKAHQFTDGKGGRNL